MIKQQFSLAIILIASIFIFSSCNNEPIDTVLAAQLAEYNSNTGAGGGGGTGGNSGTGFFKADFNGQNWVATAASANIYNGKIELVGMKGGQNEGFGFILNGTTAGTYSSSTNLLSFSPANSTDAYIGINPNNANEVAGSVVINGIDTVNHTISGIFNFKGYWSDTTVSNVAPINFTNGVFMNIPYTTTNPVTDTFYAKVDGVEFVENTIDVATTISSGFPDSYSIVASKTNGDRIGISIAQSLPVGTYQFAGAFGQQINSSCLLNNVLYNGDTGSITITSKTATHMEGTFNVIEKNFTTNQTKAVTEGAFSVDLP